jgi:hypothetical protein
MGRNGPGQREKAGWPGFPHNGKERAGTRGKTGWPGFPLNGKERAGTRGEKRSRSRKLFRERDWNRNELCRLCAVLFLTRPRDVGAARGRRFAAVAVGELGGVRVLSAGRSTGSGADSVDAVEAVGSALIFCPGSEKERNFSATVSVS